MRLFAMAWLMLASPLWAEHGPMPLVDSKLFNMNNRFEITAFAYDVSLRNLYVEHPYAAHLALVYHPIEWLGIEAYGGYVFLRNETALLRKIRQLGELEGNLSLPSLWQTSWFAGGDLQWAPLYAKISVLSELDLNFQLYILAGGGAEGIFKAAVEAGQPNNRIRFNGNVGLGFRIFLIQHLALRAEFRQSLFQNPGETGVDGTSWIQLGISAVI